MKFTLGFSPCPNDTFIFDAIVNGNIDTGGYEFDIVMEDVQTLNKWALEGKLDISKVSYGVWPQLKEDYTLLKSGGALGKGVGPLLIGHEAFEGSEEALKDYVRDAVVAIPGKETTAHFLFSNAFPDATNKVFKVFNEIEAFVQDKKGLGVIIHENRFTYAQKGLHKLMDLGSFWESTTGAPIPLGGIVAKNSIDNEHIEAIDTLIKNSVKYSIDRYPFLSEFIIENAQEMSETVMRNHIELYVNEFSIERGENGDDAVALMESYFNVKKR
ncbi:1,4-dihydroxy-6-naphthoate synthase [Polluticaenibacter yanchengensis]|uniref:1,4-dihydroxy-6-naphtoate synthase n=1 Tax=Polluticaenibacter yanchengensis TaxID=3014562 RepID=A0ABT4UKE5_9BACT|nr:1,4-dihydroxy-6-naphthoate synthase [Chitinophagaceae bacterium LY-5]